MDSAKYSVLENLNIEKTKLKTAETKLQELLDENTESELSEAAEGPAGTSKSTSVNVDTPSDNKSSDTDENREQPGETQAGAAEGRAGTSKSTSVHVETASDKTSHTSENHEQPGEIQAVESTEAAEGRATSSNSTSVHVETASEKTRHTPKNREQPGEIQAVESSEAPVKQSFTSSKRKYRKESAEKLAVECSGSEDSEFEQPSTSDQSEVEATNKKQKLSSAVHNQYAHGTVLSFDDALAFANEQIRTIHENHKISNMTISEISARVLVSYHQEVSTYETLNNISSLLVIVLTTF